MDSKLIIRYFFMDLEELLNYRIAQKLIETGVVTVVPSASPVLPSRMLMVSAAVEEAATIKAPPANVAPPPFNELVA